MKKTAGFKKEWFEEWFDENYLHVYAHRDDSDAGQLVNLILSEVNPQKNDLILDAACGSGRHARQFAEKGYRIFGVDLSLPLLRKAKKERKRGLFPQYIRADIRAMPFAVRFDLILSLFTSFGYFQHDQENQQLLFDWAGLLKKNGQVVIDYLNPEYVIENLNPNSIRAFRGIQLEEKRWIEDNRVYKKIDIIRDKKCCTFHESVRLYAMKEMRTMLSKAGIGIKKVYGSYQRHSFCSASPRMIIIGEKINAN